MKKKSDYQFLSNHYRTLLNIIAFAIVLRIEREGVACVMSNDDTVINVRNNEVLVGSDNVGFVKGSNNGWIVCIYVQTFTNLSDPVNILTYWFHK